MSNDGDEGGYGRPPKDKRFKPGYSGNPKGRPKGARNLKTDLSTLMRKRVPVREDGEMRYVSRQEALLLTLYAKAVQGDTKAASQLFTMVMKIESLDATPPQPDVVTDNDRTIVADFLRRNLPMKKEEDES
jgi:uncharacterized protein DUF5681